VIDMSGVGKIQYEMASGPFANGYSRAKVNGYLFTDQIAVACVCT